VSPEVRIPVATDRDIVAARQEGRRLAASLNFSPSDLTVIASAISEVARNIVTYGRNGHVAICLVERAGRRGVAIVAQDEGPGIQDLTLAMQDGYSTSGSLGLGLPGARRLVDEFEIRSTADAGTTVTMRKWAR